MAAIDSEDSRIGMLLEYLLTQKAIDCVKAIPAKHKHDEAIYLAVLLESEGQPYQELRNLLGLEYERHGVIVEPGRMLGRDLRARRELRGLPAQPRYQGVPLRIDDTVSYPVLRIRYDFPEFGAEWIGKCRQAQFQAIDEQRGRYSATR